MKKKRKRNEKKDKKKKKKEDDRRDTLRESEISSLAGTTPGQSMRCRRFVRATYCHTRVWRKDTKRRKRKKTLSFEMKTNLPAHFPFASEMLSLFLPGGGNPVSGFLREKRKEESKDLLLEEGTTQHHSDTLTQAQHLHIHSKLFFSSSAFAACRRWKNRQGQAKDCM